MAVDIEITVTLSPSLATLPRRLKRAVDDAHDDSARELVGEIRLQIIEVGAVSSKALLNSIERQFEDRGAVRAWLVGSPLIHGPVVEYGRRANGPQFPVAAIQKWMALRGIDGDRSTAYRIMLAVARRGLKPRFPFRRAMEAHAPRVQEIFERKVEATITE